MKIFELIKVPLGTIYNFKQLQMRLGIQPQRLNEYKVHEETTVQECDARMFN
ncbi:MAG: hypothetical protein NVS3B8_17090 [Chitinophagaceae bacterium]